MLNETLDNQAYEALKTGAEVLSRDLYGEKVLKLSDGSILKLFRLKRLLSSALINPYHRRFIQNAKRLHQKGIITVDVQRLVKLPSIKRTGVLYTPLNGSNIRDLGQLSLDKIKQVGAFLATLHEQGIYFRSFHLGNVVELEDGNLGLIDVSDMKIFNRPLTRSQRLRNFRHLFRYQEDVEQLGGVETFLQGYNLTSKILDMKTSDIAL